MKNKLLISLFAGSILMLSPVAGTAQGETVVTIDPAAPGLTFEGLGALSAGAASLLLQNYPEQQRNEILDLLFKPGCGAAYQVLKVEIGGDINSTDGTEPSHARTRGEMENPKPEYFSRGYEWWLMKEAKKRNPDIKLSILEWGAPGWIGERPEPERKRTALAEKNIQWFFDEIANKRWHQPYFPERWRRFYSQDNADYIAAYILGLKKYHDLTIDYCGIWNETHYDATWIKLLRRTLDAKGLKHVRITAADQCLNKRWDISDEMLEDPELMNIVSEIGAHYPGWGMPTPNAWKTGKPLAASEECDWGGLDWGGALGYARTFNCNYINGRMTRSIVWNAMVSYYDMLPAPSRGTMRANQPWSGHYQLSPGLWAFAHTTQFSKPGWRYLDSGCGTTNGTSYVTVCDPAQPSRFSIVVESSKAKALQKIRIKLADAVATNRLHLWRSTVREPFTRQNDLVQQNSEFVLDVEPHCLYTVTTTEGQGKGTFTPPPPQLLPFPFAEDFEKSEESRAPRYFVDIGGAFEVAQRPDGNGKCLKQVITQPGIDWIWVTPGVLSIVGDHRWKDYRVSCDARSDGRGMVALYGRLGSIGMAQNYESFPVRSYALELHDSGMWRLKMGKRILEEGLLKTSASNAWRRLELEFTGTQIVARIDGSRLADISDTSCKAGMVGVGSGYHQAWFDNLTVTPVAARTPLPSSQDSVQSPRSTFSGAKTPVTAVALPKPSPPQLAWQQAELVAMFGLDPRSYHPRRGTENIQNVYLGEEKARAYAEVFNPDKLDTDQWIRAAKEMGATAAVLVAKHEVGFCLWQSDANPYCLKMLKWRDGKGDIMRDFVNSCRKFGIKPGVFTTTRFDNRLGINNSVPMKNAVITREHYNRLVEAETQELLSRYGDLFELWLDGSARTPAQGGPDLLPIFEKHQPKTSIFYHTDDRRDVRWGGTESGMVGDPCWSTVKDRSKMNWGTGSPDGAFWCPAMADTPLRSANGRHDWFWWPDAEKGVLPLNSLKNIYLNSVGRNATLVIGLTPDLRGLLPQPDVERCREFGAWRQQTFGGEPLGKTSGTGAVLTLDLPESAAKAELFVVLQEDIREGERVREYVLEREVGGVWTECRKGTNIGHKRIIRVKPEGARRLRLTVVRSVAEPIIANFCVY